MSSGIEISPQIWNWYVGFFLSMGMVSAAAIVFTFAILTFHWLYLSARHLESKSTPSSLHLVFFRLSVFQALVIGALLVPVGVTTLYYFLFSLIWKLAPSPVEGASPDFGSMPDNVWFSSMASLIIWLIAATVLIAGLIFILLRRYANSIDPGEFSIGFARRFSRSYFQESVLVGFLLVLGLCPVILYFLINLSWLALIIVPSASHALPKIAFQNAENLYLKGLNFISYWIILVLFIPAIGLLLRGIFLKWRYTIDNPALKLLFIRSVKLSIVGLLGWLGCVCMYFFSDEISKLILRVIHG
jgi:hypothetical protein